MLRVRTTIGPSTIEGIGLFAAEPIPRGTVIWELDERFDRSYDLRNLNDADTLLLDMLETYGYRPTEDPVFVLCGDNARFMNHAEQPNCDDIGDLTIAQRDIAAGEEITCDYAKFDHGYAEREFIKLYARQRRERQAA